MQKNDPRTMRKTIEDLPQELIVEIVKSVGESSDGSFEKWKDWYNLCLIKPFGPAATELLYQEVAGNCRFSTGNDCFLLRTLLQNTKLAALVKNMDLEEGGIGLTDHSGRLKMSHEDINMLRGALIRYFELEDLKDEEMWVNFMDTKKCKHALGALLLHHASNVESMRLSGYECSQSPYHSVLASSSQLWTTNISEGFQHFTVELGLTFKHLKKVKITMGPIVQAVPFIKLPAIQELTIYGSWNEDVGSDVAMAMNDPSKNSSSVKVLRIFGKIVHEDCLSWFIDACQALECFMYVPGWVLPLDYRFGFAKVGKALQKHKNSLQKLWIYDTEANELCHTPIESLSNPIKLKEVRIEAGILFPDKSPPTYRLSHLLPVSIRHLQVVHPWPALFEKGSAGFWELTGAESELLLFPQLECVDIKLNLGEEWEEELSAVEVFRKAWDRDAVLNV